MNKDSISVAVPADSDAELLPELTPRQRQVLALIKAGKVNKEIANELGIGLGTVKQHVVALFKKLHVSNRAMAVSQGLSLAASAEAGDEEIGETLLERRPCIVLSIVLPDALVQANANPKAIIHELRQTFSALAANYDALFLPGKTHIGDLIFGIKRSSEQDIFKALRSAHTVYTALADYPDIARNLRGGLTAGLAITSMNRHGGWSGEVVASTAMTQARELAGRAPAGELGLDAAARQLLAIIGPGAQGLAAASLGFNTLNRMPWGKKLPRSQQPEDLLPMLGRDAERDCLEKLLAGARNGKTNIVYIEGETGMGKSLLCRYASEQGLGSKARVHHFVCHDGGLLFMFPGGAPVQPESLLHCLGSASGISYEVIIIDDAHLMPAGLLAQALEEVRGAKLVVVAGRKLSGHAKKFTETIKLGHLPAQAIAQLVDAQQQAQQAEIDVSAIVQYASGVPLFALELARHGSLDGMPLPLQVVINARMDGLGLDRMLLRRVGKAPEAMTAEAIAEALWEPLDSIRPALERAIASGVLQRHEDGRIAFAHPLLRMLVRQAAVES